HIARRERHGLLLLAFLTTDLFARVTDALALVGFGRTDATDAGGDFADQLLVDAADADFGLLRHGEGDARRRRDVHVVAEAELHGERLALHRRAVAHADELESLLVALGHALDHVADQGARQAPHAAGALGVVARSEGQLRPFLLDLDLFGHGPGELALGPLHRDGLAIQRDAHAGGDRDGLLTNTRHG